jgi:hypothetical protein
MERTGSLASSSAESLPRTGAPRSRRLAPMTFRAVDEESVSPALLGIRSSIAAEGAPGSAKGVDPSAKRATVAEHRRRRTPLHGSRVMTDHLASSDAKPRPGLAGEGLFFRAAALVLAVAILLYGAAYGVARWRKFIVMSECCLGEKGPIVRRTQPGFDLRSERRGQARNEANVVVFMVFRPLCALEDLMRGGRAAQR